MKFKVVLVDKKDRSKRELVDIINQSYSPIVLDWVWEDYADMMETSDDPKYKNIAERVKRGGCYVDIEVADLCNEYVQGKDLDRIYLARKKDAAVIFWEMDVYSYQKKHFSIPMETAQFWFRELDAEDRSRIYDREAHEISREEFMAKLGLENIGAA